MAKKKPVKKISKQQPLTNRRTLWAIGIVLVVVLGAGVLLGSIKRALLSDVTSASTTATSSKAQSDAKRTITQNSVKSQKTLQSDTLSKEIADGISVQSTGYSQYGGKYHYGFILTNDKEFSGTVTIQLDGPSGSLSNAITFIETNLGAGTGDTGQAGWSGFYTHYNYKVTIGDQSYDYTGGSINSTE
jgi:hypothetical protein